MNPSDDKDHNIGMAEFKAFASEIGQLGHRSVDAFRNWLHDRRDEMRQQFDDRDYPRSQGTRDFQRDRGDDYAARDQAQDRRASQDRDATRSDWAGTHRPGPQSGYREAGFGQRHGAGMAREWDETDYTGRGSQVGGRSSFDDDYQGREDRWSEHSGGRYAGTPYDSYGRQREPQHGAAGYEQGGAYGAGLGRSMAGMASGRDFSAGDHERGYRRGMSGSYYEYPDSGAGQPGMGRGSPGRAGLGAQGHRGKGPRNYARSDERIAEDLNERLSDDYEVDASDIEVKVSGGKVTLDGSVQERWQKHRAEDIACACGGVQEVDNRIRIASGAGRSRAESVLSGSSDAGPGSGRTTGDATGNRTSGL